MPARRALASAGVPPAFSFAAGLRNFRELRERAGRPRSQGAIYAFASSACAYCVAAGSAPAAGFSCDLVQ
jgi:hypothetical protein